MKRWHEHSDFANKHSFLAPSKVGWENYTPDDLYSSYGSSRASVNGTKMHELAARYISMKYKVPKSINAIMLAVSGYFGYAPSFTKEQLDNFRLYVNDAIGFGMRAEQPLIYSKWAFGTCDTISFKPEKGDMTLRIHDLKTGFGDTHIEQLLKYAALFCLEYNVKPGDFNIILAIYQLGEINWVSPEPSDVVWFMDKYRYFSNLLDEASNEIQ